MKQPNRTATRAASTRSTLLTSTLLAGALMSGCASGSADSPPGGTPTSTPTPAESDADYPARTAPAKSLDVRNQCAVIPAEQARSLGADQAPREVDFLEKPACKYLRGTDGKGFMAVISVDKSRSMKELVEERKFMVGLTEVGGYPAADLTPTKTNGILVVDISDRGSLFVNTVSSTGTPAAQEVATKFAEAALENLPNA